MTTFDFPRATPVERGCGERSTGVYAESALSKKGQPLEHFLIDPPQPLPEGLDIINKPQLWEDPDTGICHLLIWIGAEHYPYAPDVLEEGRRYGFSRRLNPNMELERLTSASRMILAHSKVFNTDWEVQNIPTCLKEVPGHEEPSQVELGPMMGPCLFKLWDLIPEDEATEVLIDDPKDKTCLREISSTVYMYHPMGESTEGLRPGLFAALPITGFALIQDKEGKVNQHAKLKLEEAELNFYETDK